MKRFLAVTAVFISTCALAFAQDEVREDGPYVRIGGGATFVNDWEQDITFNPNVLFPGVVATTASTEFNTGYTAGAAIGFDYADGIRTELEYRYARADVESLSTTGPVANPSGNVGVHFIFSNFYFDFTNNSRITPFIGGGVGGAFVKEFGQRRDSALAYQGRAGISYLLGSSFFADVEYVYVRTNNLVFGPADEDFVSSGQLSRLDGERYQSSSVVLSLRKHF